MDIKRKISRQLFCTVLLFSLSFAGKAQYLPIIPQPQHVVVEEGKLTISQELVIHATPLAERAVTYLREELDSRFQRFAFVHTDRPAQLLFETISTDDGGGDEYYELEVRRSDIIIRATGPTGYFRAVSSLLQLLESVKSGKQLELPLLKIKDQPRYGWRGFMLDESRHFFGKEKVKQLLDWMAFYKLNVFHWHLTDEPAWRIAIKKYPFLTLVGGIGSYTDPTNPAKYYSQEDIKEVVAYAQSLYIRVVPEIDMPGHATAANRAYPSLSGGGTEEHPHFTFHPAKETTYTFLANVLKETNMLFPSNLLHLGGDEVAFGSDAWNKDAKIDSLKSRLGFLSNKDVETYFMRRMADTVYSIGAKLLVWDEMADAGLPVDKSILFWWRHDKISQFDLLQKKGYPTVVCPRLPFYFDFVQDEKDENGRKWGEAFNSLMSVYRYDITALEGRAINKDLILGVQANLWTERVASDMKLEYMTFPRIAALAEVAWTKDARKNEENFRAVLKKQLSLYRRDNLYFYDPFAHGNVEPAAPVINKKYIDNPE
ncbi:beta-N-acetylhexosaminidase [Sphingobacterium suaedae]|uniref:beta-N-acetylhexosaminidase n=1 Tax=Sphingobacterium suaedae TaxID=1686402 RepID=A0ABW5KFY5_9SPHI